MFLLKELPTKNILEAYQMRFPEMDVNAVDSALHLLRRASRLLRTLEEYFAIQDLSQIRFLILIVLDREPANTRLQAMEIANRLDVSRPVVTRTLQALIQDRLIEVQSDDSDGRAKLFSLTPNGRSKLESTLPGYYRLIKEFAQHPE